MHLVHSQIVGAILAIEDRAGSASSRPLASTPMDVLSLLGGALAAAASWVLSSVIAAVSWAMEALLSALSDALEDWTDNRFRSARGWITAHLPWRSEQVTLPDSGPPAELVE